MAYGPVRGKKLAGRDVFWEREETDAALFRPGPCTYPSPLSTGESAAACACLTVLCGPERVLAASSYPPTGCQGTLCVSLVVGVSAGLKLAFVANDNFEFLILLSPALKSWDVMCIQPCPVYTVLNACWANTEPTVPTELHPQPS